jgi:energy-coupling factor transport system ATP-binding protein
MVLQDATSQLFADSVAGELALAERTSPESCGYSHDEILEMLHLLHLKERHPMSLSGGENSGWQLPWALCRMPMPWFWTNLQAV